LVVYISFYFVHLALQCTVVLHIIFRRQRLTDHFANFCCDCDVTVVIINYRTLIHSHC